MANKAWLRSLLVAVAVSPFMAPLMAQATPYIWSLEQTYPDAEILATWQSARSGSFTGVDNVAIRYRIFANAAQPERDAIVIVNGRTESMAKYRELIHDLRKQGFAVYAYDHRGQGYSGRMQRDAQKGYVKHFDDYVADLHVFVESQAKKAGHNNLYLLTHSMGGAIGSLYLANYPHPFKAAALSSPMHQINAGPLNLGCGVGATINAIDGLFGEQSAFVPGGGSYSPDPFQGNVYTTSENRYTIFRAAFEQEPQLQIGSPTVRWVSEACDGAKRAREQAGAISIPVMVLQGGNDRVVTAAGQQEFCVNLAAGKKSQCESGAPIVIDGAEHEIFIERDELRNGALDKVLNFYSRFR